MKRKERDDDTSDSEDDSYTNTNNTIKNNTTTKNFKQNKVIRLNDSSSSSSNNNKQSNKLNDTLFVPTANDIFESAVMKRLKDTNTINKSKKFKYDAKQIQKGISIIVIIIINAVIIYTFPIHHYLYIIIYTSLSIHHYLYIIT